MELRCNGASVEINMSSSRGCSKAVNFVAEDFVKEAGSSEKVGKRRERNVAGDLVQDFNWEITKPGRAEVGHDHLKYW